MPLPDADNKEENARFFEAWVNQTGDFCAWDATNGGDTGCGLAKVSAWVHGPCRMINWTRSPICTKVFCGEDMIYACRRGQGTLGDILCDLFIVS